MKFNTEKEKFIELSPRKYLHEKCKHLYDNQKSKEERDLTDLEEYIKKLFNEDSISEKHKRQINEFKKTYGYTYSGMLRSLKYFFEKKGNPIEKARGSIGIIPYIYTEAGEYYTALWNANQINKDKNIQSFKPQEVIVSIASPKKRKLKSNLFSFLDKEDEN